jgi:hypothetical protein
MERMKIRRLPHRQPKIGWKKCAPNGAPEINNVSGVAESFS